MLLKTQQLSYKSKSILANYYVYGFHINIQWNHLQQIILWKILSFGFNSDFE